VTRRGARALVIGAGHNGLVCAFYLARAGWRVRMLERRDLVGGAAVTEEFHPGFRNSTASYTVGLLDARVMRDLKLAELGLRIVPRALANFLPLDARRSISVGAGVTRTQAEFSRHSPRDAERLPDYLQQLNRIAVAVRRLAATAPPRLDGSWLDVPALIASGWALRSLSRPDRECLRQLLTDSAEAFLDRWFESAAVKAAFGFDSVVGNYRSPREAGSAYMLLHHVFGQVNGERGVWGHAIGGMGAITQTMRTACERLGVEILTGVAVRRVHVVDNTAVAVETEDGQSHEASRVIANVNPRLLFDRMLSDAVLPGAFRAEMRGYRLGSGTLRMNVALSELPRFPCVPGEGPGLHHQSGIIVAPSLTYMHQAIVDARREGWSREPIIEMLIPSTVDDSLAPPGAHVASLFCQQFAPRLPGGGDWNRQRERVADLVVDTMTRHAPNFRASIIARQVLTPLDLEQRFGLTAGDIMHGDLRLDQLWAARPTTGYGGYRTPVRNLYLCGSGAHPGGGVSGLPGRNAARVLLRDSRLPWPMRAS
jgi:phytoene dehydrogenase-like protein